MEIKDENNKNSDSKQMRKVCYCGKDRNLSIVEVACSNCNRFFHESCIGYQFGKILSFSMNYVFTCKLCSLTGLESYRRTSATIQQMCITTLANLQRKMEKEGNPRYLFNKDEIITFIEMYWESITTIARKQTNSWHFNIIKTLQAHQNLFLSQESDGETLYGLLDIDLTNIKPNYESSKSGSKDESNQNVSKVGRQPKRKLTGNDFNNGPTGKKGRPAASDLSAIVKLPQHGYPLDHPYNKEGYRYILAEPDPHAPFRQEYDESPDWAGKPIPGWLYRVLTPNAVLAALHDKAPQMRCSDDRLSVTGEKGYCMARCTHFVSRGSYYWEATIEEMPEGSACRIGWGQEYANLQSPLGYDKFGYSWRSRKGTKFHESHGKTYSSGYGEGDTLGILIELPEQEGVCYLPNTYKDRPLVKFKSHLYYEDKDKVNDSLKNLKIHPNSKVHFFKNGQFQGVAFENIFSGAYYPAVSVHKNATVSLNFGGEGFKYPDILKEFNCKSMHERVEEFVCEQTIADVFFFTENDGKLRL